MHNCLISGCCCYNHAEFIRNSYDCFLYCEPMPRTLELSTLRHTWIFDLDGTLVEHNGYKNGRDYLLPGVKVFFSSIPEEDFIIILTAREKSSEEATKRFLAENGIRYNAIFFEIPMGERILVNDNKPSGLVCAFALTPVRNQGLEDFNLIINESL